MDSTAKFLPAALATSERVYYSRRTLCGSDGWLRIGGSPWWLYGPEKHRSRDDKPMTFVGAIGYDAQRNSAYLDEEDELMLAEGAYYFFATKDLKEMVVSFQST